MAAKSFNEHPRKSLEHLVGLGVISDATDAAEVAHFCRTCPGIDKDVLGQYLGKVSGDFNKKVLAAFVQTFDWTDTPLDLAVRNFLQAFKLFVPSNSSCFDACCNKKFKIGIRYNIVCNISSI